MRWNSSEPSWQDVVGALREAARCGEKVWLDDGLSDEEIDGWGVAVPEPVREICRRVGLLHIGDYDEFGASHPDNGGGEGGEWRCGEPGAFRILHTNTAAETYYVDIDGQTGVWGPVFTFWEDHGAELVAPSLQHWLVNVAKLVGYAARDRGHFNDFSTAFLNWFFGDFSDADKDFPADSPEAVARLAEPATAEVMTAQQARESDDPVLTDAASRLPEGALLADLRKVNGPVRIPFDRHPNWPAGTTPVYQRFHGGKILAAKGVS